MSVIIDMNSPTYGGMTFADALVSEVQRRCIVEGVCPAPYIAASGLFSACQGRQHPGDPLVGAVARGVWDQRRAILDDR